MELVQMGLIIAVCAILGILMRALDKTGKGSRTGEAAAAQGGRTGLGDYGFVIDSTSPLY